MLGREELEVWSSCELHIKRGFDREFKAGNVYLKTEADKVMDAMEARIEELESQCTKYQAELMNNDLALERRSNSPTKPKQKGK